MFRVLAQSKRRKFTLRLSVSLYCHCLWAQIEIDISDSA